MATYLTPGVYFEEIDEAETAVASIRTDVTALVGVTAMGRVGRAKAVESWAQFQAAFGGFLPNAYLAYAANAFFENGGKRLYVVRVAAPHVSTMSDSAVPQPSDGAVSYVASTAGFVPGAVVTVQQTATASVSGVQPSDRLSSLLNTVAGFPAGSVVQITQPVPFLQAWHRVTSVDPVAKRLYWDSALESGFLLTAATSFASFHEADALLSAVAANALTWAAPLAPAFNPALPIQFDTGVAAAAGVLADSSGAATLAVHAASPGIWGDRLSVSVSRSSMAATTTASGSQPPTGAYSLVQSVVGFALRSYVRIYQSHSPLPVVGFRQVTAVNPASCLLQWDLPLTPSFDVTQPLSFETVEFSLTVALDGSAKETFTGLSLDPAHPRYAPLVVNPRTPQHPQPAQVGMPSAYIRVADLQSSTAIPGNLPDPTAPQLQNGWLSLWGGRDGIAALRIEDFIGDPGSDRKWGIRALEDVDEVSIVAAPDILIEPVPAVLHVIPPQSISNPCLPCDAATPVAPAPDPLPVEATPQFSLEEVFQVQQALIAHCVAMQFRFAILDPPDFGYPALHVDLGEVQSWRRRFDTMYGALYYPWILVLDPLAPLNQSTRRIPPSGHVAGVYANTDLTVGVYKAPANSVIQWITDLTNHVTPEMQALLNPLGVNCVRSFLGRGLRIYGARTLSSDPSWRFVNVRRLMCMIEHAIENSMQWIVFEPNSVHLWNLVRSSITSFLNSIWKQGALAGNTAADAFYVKCDSTNNPPALSELGEMVVEIGVAPARPAEFVVFRLGQQQDSLQVVET